MKLCQKCADAIREFEAEDGIFLPTNKPVPESDCEFWAHMRLRGWVY